MAGPRIAPLLSPELNPVERGALGAHADRRPLPNLFATLARHPQLAAAYIPFGTYIMAESTLAARDRQLVILRVALRTDCAYEFLHHARIAEPDLTEADMARVVDGPDAGWSGRDSALLQCVDELIDHAMIADGTWSELADVLDDHQLMDLVFTIGTYTLLAGALNSFGVDLDPDLDPSLWPAPATTNAGASSRGGT